MFSDELWLIIIQQQHNSYSNLGTYGVTSRAGRIWGRLYSKTYVLQATPESRSWPINFLVYNRSEDRESGAKTIQDLLKVTFAQSSSSRKHESPTGVWGGKLITNYNLIVRLIINNAWLRGDAGWYPSRRYDKLVLSLPKSFTVFSSRANERAWKADLMLMTYASSTNFWEGKQEGALSECLRCLGTSTSNAGD